MLKYFGLLLIFVASTLAAKIVGGGKADIRDHPYQVLLQRRKCGSNFFKPICGGCIIKANRILTAAHCIEKHVARNFMVAAGSNHLHAPNAVKALVSSIIVHPLFDEATLDNDVAILYLSKDLPLNQVTINTIALATQAPQPGSWASATGWGAIVEGGCLSNILYNIVMPIIDNVSCNKIYSQRFGDGSFTKNMICAGINGVQGFGTCQGDSGGPLVYNGELVGVVSWALGCGRPDAPIAFANVPELHSWITRNI